MFKQVYKYDENGNYVEPVIIGVNDELPPNCTDQELPQPNWKPVFKNGAWVETITQEELDEINNQPIQPSAEERISLMEKALDELLLGGM